GADAQKAAVLPDQRGTTPLRVRGRSEQGFVEHVLPVAGKFPLRDDFRLERMGASAVADDDYIGVRFYAGRRRRLQRTHAESAKRLHQSEAAALVVGQRMPLYDGAAIGAEPDRLGFGDQVADRHDQPVLADYDA